MSGEHDEARLSRRLSRLLLAGLSLGIVLMLTGAVLAGVDGGAPVARESSVSGLLSALAGREPGGFFDLGLLVLLATPIARVAALLVSFVRQKAWLFSAVGLFVLVALALSALLGLTAE